MKQKSLIDVLHDTQEEEEKNYLSRNKMIEIAKTTKISETKVYGVSTFYTMFSVYPRGKHIIRVCRNLSCHLSDAEKIAEKLKEILNVDFGETTEDGEFTLEESSCLGMCSVSPAMTIDDEPFGNLVVENISEILLKVKEGSKK
jgi:NADH-quinone oxidoreductase subunit E